MVRDVRNNVKMTPLWAVQVEQEAHATLPLPNEEILAEVQAVEGEDNNQVVDELEEEPPGAREIPATLKNLKERAAKL